MQYRLLLLVIPFLLERIRLSGILLYRDRKFLALISGKKLLLLLIDESMVRSVQAAHT
jgi:hypothetical protein